MKPPKKFDTMTFSNSIRHYVVLCESRTKAIVAHISGIDCSDLDLKKLDIRGKKGPF